jgi:hypothetical protein
MNRRLLIGAEYAAFGAALGAILSILWTLGFLAALGELEEWRDPAVYSVWKQFIAIATIGFAILGFVRSRRSI